jgi:hypothetical protein
MLIASLDRALRLLHLQQSQKNACAPQLLAELQSINDTLIGDEIDYASPITRCSAFRYRSLMCLIPIAVCPYSLSLSLYTMIVCIAVRGVEIAPCD